MTEYLSTFEVNKIQSTDGVIYLTDPYQGRKLNHHDKVIFTGKLLDKEHLEGTISYISAEGARSFKEYAILLKNQGEFLKEPLLSRE